jgi:hypothetical protein
MAPGPEGRARGNRAIRNASCLFDKASRSGGDRNRSSASLPRPYYGLLIIADGRGSQSSSDRSRTAPLSALVTIFA